MEPFLERSKAIYTDPSKYFLITLTIAVVHTAPRSIHRQQLPSAMRRYLPLPLSFPRMTEEFGSGDRWQPAAANSARCLRAFRRRTATNPRRPIDSTAGKNIGAAFHAQSAPRFLPSTAQWRKNGPFCLAFFLSLFPSAPPISLLRSLAASFSPIKFDLESFGRVHEISRRYEGERKREEWDKGMEILTLARLPRGLIVSWPLVGLIGR